jgi:hypothetical protein
MTVLIAALTVIAMLGLGGDATRENRRSKNIDNPSWNTGRFDQKTLLSNARPYDRNSQADRTLAGNDYQKASLASYSVQFDSCISLTVKDDNLLNYASYAKEGLVVSQKSFVIFHLCENDSCDDGYQSQSSSNNNNTYVVDINTFVLAMASYTPTMEEEYCQQCRNNEEYCLGTYTNNRYYYYSYAQEQQHDNNNGQRKLDSEYIDCVRCDSYRCFENDSNSTFYNKAMQISNSDALDWLQGVAACEETGQYYNEMALYAGIACNGDGTGMEIAFFLDDACTLYTTETATADDEQYYETAVALMTTAATTTIPCGQSLVEYTNPYDEQQQQQNDGDQEMQVEEYCQDLFQGEWGSSNDGSEDKAVQNLNNCIAEDEADSESGSSNESNEYDDDAWAKNMAWYQYDIDQEDLENNPGKICTVVKEVQGEFFGNWGYHHNSGGWAHTKAVMQKKYGVGAGGMIALLLGSLVLVCGSCWWAYNRSDSYEMRKAKKKAISLSYPTSSAAASSKRVPLVRAGEMV